MTYGVIYCLTNTVNGKVYIGQTRDYAKRINQYRLLRCKTQPYIYAAIQKHGWDRFKAEIVDTASDKTQLDFLEMIFISKFNAMNAASGYNLRAGGAGSPLSEDSRAKLIRSRRARQSIIEELKILENSWMDGGSIPDEQLELYRLGCKKTGWEAIF
jgi:group I intron endonuclease